MKFGLTEEEYGFITEQVITPLRAQGAHVFCYGSRARGDNQPFSDLDIMVEASVELSELISQLQEQLTNSNFPYKVDLVELKDFAESYQSGYQQDKVPW
ncbi:nucleotidyltransferase domain-containing protein [Alcanivorax sp.]|jgi:predicted nucleotidyltransferase|uniref:nucleotidyltransferase family protein n=1 Tax=Alcanivorax sp. TaxID=1872427 RepID=UPI0032D9AB05